MTKRFYLDEAACFLFSSFLLAKSRKKSKQLSGKKMVSTRQKYFSGK